MSAGHCRVFDHPGLGILKFFQAADPAAVAERFPLCDSHFFQRFVSPKQQGVFLLLPAQIVFHWFEIP
jgi:hypothetical protein